MHKNGKWARQLIEWQDGEGKWGTFHSLATTGTAHVTTEQALRRLERLGYTMEDACIQKAVAYMSDCLTGKKTIPDRVEKVHDWNIFTSLLLATWIRRFTYDNPHANEVARKWAQVITHAFAEGAFQYEAFVSAYHDILGMKPNGGRLIDFVNFYPISLLRDCLDERTECAMMDYVLNKDGGIYYIYEGKLSVLPQSFESKAASRYLAAIELLAGYRYARHELGFVADWLYANQKENGKWDMGKSVNDKVYFPLSDDWRRSEVREADCTERVERLLKQLQA